MTGRSDFNGTRGTVNLRQYPFCMHLAFIARKQTLFRVRDRSVEFDLRPATASCDIPPSIPDQRQLKVARRSQVIGVAEVVLLLNPLHRFGWRQLSRKGLS